jgi:N,N'-diacetylchitobiose non-reducing end deacetylase
MDLFDLAPVPNLMAAKRILCIQPHPDDMDIACGGTLAVLAAQGAHITYLTVTSGGAGSIKRRDEVELALTRKQEQMNAGALIGVKDYIWLDYWDAGHLTGDQLERDFIRAIRLVRPDTVITIDGWLPYEAHPAHRKVGQCAAAAVLFSGMGNIGWEDNLAPHTVDCIALAFTGKPNTYVDVTAKWNLKLRAIRAHESQFPDSTWPFYNAYFDMKAKQYGARLGVEKAEALKVLAPIHLHCNVDALDM